MMGRGRFISSSVFIAVTAHLDSAGESLFLIA